MLITYPHPCPITLRGSAVIIGNFDGVHLGHQALIQKARATGLRVVALSFTPHPREFFSKKPIFTLTPQKEALLKAYGVEALALCQFDAAFAALLPQEFIDKILMQWLGAKAVFTGEGFCFGAKRAGDTELLSHQFFTFEAVHPILFKDAVVSSSQIRKALSEGDVTHANALLGRAFGVSGTVIHGRKEGRTLGYPTANIALPPDINLKHGIYAVRVGKHKGVVSFGVRPMFDNGVPLLEVHLFDFEGDLYGQELHIEFIQFLRDEQKFSSLEALITQMDKDSVQARACV